LYAREGADVTIVYLPQEQEDADETKKLVEKEGRECLAIPFDLTDLHNVDTVVEKHLEKFGKLDVLVNNASRQMMCKNFEEIDIGRIPSPPPPPHLKPLPKIPTCSCYEPCISESLPAIGRMLIQDTVEETFRTNILQMFALTKFALPHLKKGSSIINTTSVVAYRGSPAMVDYAATKGAIVSFTRSLAKQLTPKGIRVNAVAPGPVTFSFPLLPPPSPSSPSLLLPSSTSPFPSPNLVSFLLWMGI
jgi:NAD(P)-dependent dehydrogenase (short-subunit alcohol dehydrogenase family)